jgi:nicotinamidase-related amidase
MKAFDEIHLCGFDTEACVYKTALDLVEVGVRPVVLKDYCHSSDEQMHNMGLKILEKNIGKRNVR